MPAKCPYCETNTHKDKSIVCERVFITKEETLLLLSDSGHTIEMLGPIQFGFEFSPEGMLELLDTAEYFEIADPIGNARSMKHGIGIVTSDPERGKHTIFLETDESKLKAFEEKFDLVKNKDDSNGKM